MSVERRAILARVSPGLIHAEAPADDCVVEVLARAGGGTARHLVRCLFTRETAHVNPLSVRPL